MVLYYILYIYYYYINYYYILLLLLYIYIYYYIIYSILYYTLLFFCSIFLSQYYSLLFLLSQSPLPPLPNHLILLSQYSKYTCRYLHTSIYIQSSSNNLTPHKLSEVNVEWCSFNVCVRVLVLSWRLSI